MEKGGHLLIRKGGGGGGGDYLMYASIQLYIRVHIAGVVVMYKLKWGGYGCNLQCMYVTCIFACTMYMCSVAIQTVFSCTHLQ